MATEVVKTDQIMDLILNGEATRFLDKLDKYQEGRNKGREEGSEGDGGGGRRG